MPIAISEIELFRAGSSRAGLFQAIGVVVFLAAFVVLGAPAGHAEEPQTASQSTDATASKAAEILTRHCLECHNAFDKKGGLDLSRRELALTGGETGSAFVPGDPQNSLLFQRLTAGEMPPEGHTQPTAEDRHAIEIWLQAGARWESDPLDPFKYSSERRAGYDWWSLQPVRNVTPPPVSDSSWPRNPIDHFVLSKLDEAGLAPSREADRRTLIRRLSFDLLGLPPTIEEVDSFETDTKPDAYERLVDRLLDSPHYGERWARHWLDVVRFGESQGFERNKLRPNAWKYRDFVVEAFNSDLPYDDFVRWQIAGEVFQPDDPLAIAASGFLVMGPYDLTAYTDGTADMRAFAREEELEGLVATVCQTFLGLTVNCSRCHDHKFDPVSQREYYRISAALGGTYHGDERDILPATARPAVTARQESLRQRIAALSELEAEFEFPLAESKRAAFAADRARLESLARLLDGGAMHLSVPQQPGAWRVLSRGDFRQPRETVVPGGIASIAGVSPDWGLADDTPEAQRRKTLADWLASSDNPLTPRVIVNRLWGYHFGEGLVKTTSDLGFQGGRPSHPELLEWLAGELARPSDGSPWLLKRIQRLIVTSAAYRQSASGGGRGMQIDAGNRLLWRQVPRRLEAESFRDSVLAVSGQLDRQVGGPGFRDFSVSSAGNNETYTVQEAVGPGFNRRSLYRMAVRTGTSPLLDILDCPDPSVATPRRSVTSTPLQALALLNGPFSEYYAARFAERIAAETTSDPSSQARRAYALAFARLPNDDEESFAGRFIAKHGLTQFCIVLFNANEFLFVE